MVTARLTALVLPAAKHRMAEDLELPPALRLLLTAGWNLTGPLGCPWQRTWLPPGSAVATRA